MRYQRLVEIYVRPELREKIKTLKQGLTYDQYLSQIFNKKEKVTTRKSSLTPKMTGQGGISNV